MNTLIPLEYYTLLYYHLILLVVLVVYAQSVSASIDNTANIKNKATLGSALVAFIFLYAGTRPVSARYFGDMRTYAAIYENYALGESVRDGKDIYFEHFMKWCSAIMTVEFFFLLCAALYVFPLFFACKKFFKEYWFYGFIMLAASLSFWSYGVNGIRNGIATSIFLLAISRDNLKWKVALLFLSILFHKSLVIPVLAYIVVSNYKNPMFYFRFWAAAIPLSLALGGFWESFFLSFGFGEEERLQGYLSGEESEFQEQFAQTGFRWDFLIYSATGVFAGYYFTIVKKFQDPFYSNMLNTYLMANAFWILVIRATFSNRFAYLSWFMLGLVIIYPMLKMKFFKDHHAQVGKIILAYYLLTYLMNVILS